MKTQIQNLRQQINDIEARAFNDNHCDKAFISMHNAELDRLLGGGIALGHLNEFNAASYFSEIAAISFAFAMLGNCMSARGGDLIIVQDEYFAREWGEIYAIGLMKFGILPSRVLLITPKSKEHFQSCLLEALKTQGLGAVFSQISRKNSPDLLGARKLQLAAQSGKSPVFLVSAHNSAPILTASLRAKINGLGGQSKNFKWGIEIEKSRFGAIKNFNLEYDYEKHNFHLPTILEFGTQAVKRRA